MPSAGEFEVLAVIRVAAEDADDAEWKVAELFYDVTGATVTIEEGRTGRAPVTGPPVAAGDRAPRRT